VRLDNDAAGRETARTATTPVQPDDPEPPPVSPENVQSALVAALQSREFQSAPQLRSFLGFVVRATLNNEQEKLKGYTIAVEALGRPEDFNPVTDPIVRVEAARLRRRLEKYYAGSGTGDPVRIVIPKGSYAPEFQMACPKGTADRSVEHMLAFEEEESGFHPAADRMPNGAEIAGVVARDTASAAQPQGSAARTPVTPGSPLPAPGSASSRREGLWLPVRLRLSRPVPLPVTVLVAVICFLAGYLAAGL